MIFKCALCNLNFNTAEEYMEHRISHQRGQEKNPEKKQGPVCLKCGKPVSFDSSKESFRGDITCNNCGQRLKVSLENGEIIFVSLRS